MFRKTTLMCLMLTVSILSGCAKSPTGRSQITLFSEQKMATMGAQSFDEMKQQIPISKNKKLTRFVQCVADSITPFVSKESHKGDWEVVLFDSEQINAFALPGGKIGVYTGILNVTEDQHQLAAIMGHEVGHVIANHSNERMSSSSLAQTGLQVINVGLSSQDAQTQSMVMAGLGLGVQYGVLMPYGRAHEREADIIGQDLMAQAGFDPRAAVKLWKNMAKASGGSPPEFMSTHPSHETRINKLTDNLAKTLPLYKKSKQTPDCPKP